MTSTIRPVHLLPDTFDSAARFLDRIEQTQMEPLRRIAEMCADCIAADRLVHLFGSGHSRMAVEEIFPRYGSFPGFHPIVELSLTFHNPVVGANGQRQAMFIERMEGLGQAILRNFEFGPHDLMMVFSTGGTGAVAVDVALEARRLGMPVIAVTSAGAQPGFSAGPQLRPAALRSRGHRAGQLCRRRRRDGDGPRPADTGRAWFHHR